MFMFTRRILQGNEEYLYLIMIKKARKTDKLASNKCW